MNNLTISSLIFNNYLKRSPFLTGSSTVSSFKIQKSKFTKFLSPLYFNFGVHSKRTFTNNEFRYFLSNAIVILDAYSITNNKWMLFNSYAVTKQFPFRNGGTTTERIEVKYCIFHGITNSGSGFSNSASCIFYNYKNGESIFTYSLFDQCKAIQCGAVSCICSKFTITGNCI